MSAFMVENKTINKVITKLAYDRDGDWLKRKCREAGYNLDTLGGRSKLGWDMFKLNMRSISQRYGAGEAEKFRPLDYSFGLEGNYTKISALKSLRCLLYQCTEGDCDKSPLYQLMDEISNSWSYSIVSSLPEYEQAIWG